MSVMLFYNNASSTLAGPISNTATTIFLAAGGGAQFTPAPVAGQYFTMTLVDQATGLLREIIHVTNVSGDVLTVTRAQEGTVALNWLAGDLILNEWTAGSAAQMLQQGQLPGTIIYVAGADTGTANNIVVTTSPVISSLTQGAIIEVTKGAAANTGPLTIQQNGASAVAVNWANGSPLASGDWPAGATALIAYDSATLNYQLISFPNSSSPNLVHYGVATGTANALAVSFSPAISALTDGLLFEIVPSANNTAATTINANGLGAVAFEYPNGTAFAGGELVNGVPVLAMLKGGVFHLLSIIGVSHDTTLAGNGTPASPLGVAGISGVAMPKIYGWGNVDNTSGTPVLTNGSGVLSMSSVNLSNRVNTTVVLTNSMPDINYTLLFSVVGYNTGDNSVTIQEAYASRTLNSFTVSITAPTLGAVFTKFSFIIYHT